MINKLTVIRFLLFSVLLQQVQCECKKNWRAYKNNCYYFSQYARNFKKAERHCLSLESNLTSIQDTDERDWLIKTLDKSKFPWSTWMGLKYKSGGWKWTDGSRFNRSVAFWGEDQPSMYLSVTTSRCASMLSRDDGRWYNYNCIFTDMPYICKRFMEPQLFVAPNGFGALDKTEKLALEVVTNMVISGKVVPKTALNITLINGLSCSSRGVNCSRALDIKDYKARKNLQFAKLVGELEDGRVIIIKGRVHQNATRFNVSFLSNDASIPLHMSARFNWLTDVNVLVMNSYLSGKWGKEERKQGTSFPFGRGQFFEMIVKCTAKFFNMTINGDVHLSYKYRAPVAKIDRVGAKGNVTLIDIRQI